MNVFRCFGLGSGNIIAQRNTVPAIVTKKVVCWWFKVNTKPIRRHAWDGAIFPHIIYFQYIVNGIQYQGCRFVHWNSHCPTETEHITVYYDGHDPSKYAVII